MAERQYISPGGSSSGGGGTRVKPRIQEMERRMQLRSPEQKSGGGHDQHHQQRPLMSSPAPTKPRPNFNAAAQDSDNNSDKENNNASGVLALRSPLLSTFIPNSSKRIKQFESDVLKRQAESTARISDLEGRLAKFHTRLAVECAERGREHSFTVEEYVNAPLDHSLEQAMKRIENDFIRPIMDPRRAIDPNLSNPEEKQMNDGEESNNEMGQDDSKDVENVTTARTLPNLVAIERRTNLLEAHMNHHKHVTIFNSRRQNFDAIDKACRQTVQPALALEMTKADKRETGLSRRFDSGSGEWVCLAAEMTSSRVSELGYIEKEIDDWDLSDMMRAEHYLEEIQKLKQTVMREREERVRRDMFVAETIVKTKKVLQEEILRAC